MVLATSSRTYWAAEGLGTWCGTRRIRLETARPLREATLAVGEIGALLAPPAGEAVAGILRDATSVRCPGDLASFAFFLDGQADAWLEAGVKAWDLGPFPILAREAGAVFTTASGSQDLEEGTGLAALPALHAEILERWRAGLTA